MDVDHLIDISVYNEVRDWAQVARDGIKGASIKVSQQVNYLNPLAAAQFAGARSVGVAPGGYHFGDPRVSAARQASYFVANARPLGAFAEDALAPMYDAENWEGGGLVWPNPQTLNAHIAEHIRVVREETGVLRHLVYGSLSWWQDGWIDPDLWADENVLLWIALYNGQPGNLQGWDHPNDALHQHTSSGIVPGIPDRVDKNVTLRGRSMADLIIGGSDDMPNISQEDLDVLLAGARKVTTNYRIPDDERPRAIDQADDVVGHVMSLRARVEQFIASNRLQATVLADLAVAEQKRDVDERARDDADRVRDEAIIAILQGLATGDIDVSELAEKLADKLPPQISVQDMINAFVSVAGTISFRQKPTGGA